MYETYWQLDHRPFESTSDPRFYYPSESHQGAMLKLRYAIENRSGAALLCGPSGSGKSLLVNQLRRHLPKSFQPFVHLVFPQMSAEELIAYLAIELTVAGQPEGGRHQRPGIEQCVRGMQQFLGKNAEAGQHAVVAIDEAHLIDEPRSLEALRLLLNFETQSRPNLTLLLVGEALLLPQLDRMPTFEERFGVKCLLRPFTADETAAYVQFRLQAAGAKRQIFEPEALTALHELTRGIPRQINRLCDLALLVAFAEECKSIGPQQIEAVAEELVTVAPE